MVGERRIMETKELQEKIEKGLEFIENGLYNLENYKKTGMKPILDMAINQITNGKKLIDDEEIDDDVWGKPI